MTDETTAQTPVPQWPAEAIEIEAEATIEYFDQRILTRPVLTPVLEFIERCRTDFGLAFDCSRDLGFTAAGGKILGEFVQGPPTIRIDPSLLHDPRFPFTLGHEFGHFVLHRDAAIDFDEYRNGEFRDAETDLVTRHKTLVTPRQWVEWQANRFSSALLMPRATVFTAVVEAQRAMGITNNLGRVILEAQTYSFRDLNELLARLCLIYNVSRQAMQYRLADLGILVDLREKHLAHISRFLREAPKQQ